MPKRQSQAWKALERETARQLRGERVSRGDNFARSDVDVIVKDIPNLKVDCKYRTSHAHHTLMKEIQTKYCKTEQDIPLLVTKHHNQQGAYATLRLSDLAQLLDLLRAVKTMPGHCEMYAEIVREMEKERA